MLNFVNGSFFRGKKIDTSVPISGGGQQYPTPAIGEAGTFNTGVGYGAGEFAWTPVQENTFVTIDKHTQSDIHGEFHGEAYRYDEFANIISTVQILIEFRALRTAPIVGALPCPAD